MSIRTKLILSFLAAIVVAIGSISFLVSYQLGGFAERDFKVNSLGRLKLVNEFLIKFFAESEHGVAYLASLGDIQSAKGAVPSYLGERSPKTVQPDELSAPARHAYEVLAPLAGVAPVWTGHPANDRR